MSRALLAACLLAISCAPTPPAVPALRPDDLAITHVTLVPMTGPTDELADRTVIIRGDRILAIAPAAELSLPPNIRIIDGAHRWLMPGLADMHVHAWDDAELTMFVAAGVTTIRNMFGDPKHLAWRAEISHGQRLGPTIFTAGPIVDGEPPRWPGSAVLTDPAKAEALVAAQQAQGYDFIKPYSRLTRPAYDALAAAAARHHLALEGHVPDAVPLTDALAAHQKSIEHLDGYQVALVADNTSLPAGSPRAHMHEVVAARDDRKLPSLIAQTLAAGTWNCPTLVAYDRYAALDDIDHLLPRVAWLDLVPKKILHGWIPEPAYTAAEVDPTREEYAGALHVLRALIAAHAPLLVGTDTANPFVIAGASLHDELELLIKAGLSRPQAIRAATADTARFVGTPHEFGVIEPGARADLLLVATDPLTRPLPLVPDGVVLRGAWLPRQALDAKLAEIAQSNQ